MSLLFKYEPILGANGPQNRHIKVCPATSRTMYRKFQQHFRSRFPPRSPPADASRERWPPADASRERGVSSRGRVAPSAVASSRGRRRTQCRQLLLRPPLLGFVRAASSERGDSERGEFWVESGTGTSQRSQRFSFFFLGRALQFLFSFTRPHMRTGVCICSIM
jgi:hypothetical protein